MKYFLVIYAGSSQTRALVADENGQCAGFRKGRGGNHQNVGYEGFESAISSAFNQAAATSGVETNHIAGAGFVVSGYDFDSDRADPLTAISKFGLVSPHEIAYDGMNGLLTGATRGIGVNGTAVSSVTGRCCGSDRRVGRIVGNRNAFGEYGGASEILEKALKMVTQAWIRRIEPTALTGVLWKRKAPAVRWT